MIIAKTGLEKIINSNLETMLGLKRYNFFL